MTVSLVKEVLIFEIAFLIFIGPSNVGENLVIMSSGIFISQIF